MIESRGPKITWRKLAPPFFTILPGTVATACPRCGESIYLAASTEHGVPAGRLVEVDCAVIGGHLPTAHRAGSGVKHVCPEAA